MIVLDASAAVELVLQTPRAERIAARALHPAERLHAPHLIDIEVAQVMRRLVQAKEITVARADAALADFEGLVIERHGHRPLFRRVWGLRTSLSAYDATTSLWPRRLRHRCSPATTNWPGRMGIKPR